MMRIYQSNGGAPGGMASDMTGGAGAPTEASSGGVDDLDWLSFHFLC